MSRRRGTLLIGLVVLVFAALPVTADAVSFFDSRDFRTESNPNGHLMEGLLAHGKDASFSWSFQHPESYPEGGIDTEGLVGASLTITVLDAKDRLRMSEIAVASVRGDVGGTYVPKLQSGSITLDLDIQSLVQNGGLEVTVLALLGDFYVQTSVLELIYEDQGAPVPEPATLLMLGTGLIGTAVAIRRRRAPSKEA